MKHRSVEKLLATLGFGVSAAPVFEALHAHGVLSMSEIVRLAGVYRPAAYRGIRELIEAGFVTPVPHGKRTRYHAAPKAELVKAFERLVVEGKETVAAHAAKEAHDTHVGVVVREGKAAVAAVFDEALMHTKRGDTVYRYTSERNLEEVNALLSPQYRALRDKKQVERLVISNAASATQKRARLERFIKILGSEREPFEQNIIKLIYRDTVAVVDLSLLRVYTIENTQLADFERTVFAALYKRLS